MERLQVQFQLFWNWCKETLARRRIFFHRKLAKKYKLVYHDCDSNCNIRIATLMNLLQDVTQKHTSKLGYGKEYLLRHLGWVVSRYAIKIKKYPKAGDKITVLTWVSETSKMTVTRQFLIVDSKGNTLVEAVSKWGLLDLIKKRPVETPPFRISNKKLFTANFTQSSLKQITLEKSFSVLFDNIDFNGHVNNALYPLWASECIDKEFRCTHSPIEMVIAFSKEALLGDEIIVKTQVDGLKSSSIITNAKDESIHAKVTLWWGKNENALTQ